MSCMKKYVILALAALAFMPMEAFWPFSSSDSAKKKPPRLHVLLAKANELIEEGEDKALQGDAEGALKAYREALEELDRVQRENPERAEKQEFAPLRNKIAAVSAQIDNIRFQQVNRNSHPVVLTDTCELQKKYNDKHGIEEPSAAEPAEGEGAVLERLSATTEPQQQAAKPAPAKPATEPAAAQRKPAEQAQPPAKPAQQQGVKAPPAQAGKQAQSAKPAQPKKAPQRAAAAPGAKPAPAAAADPAEALRRAADAIRAGNLVEARRWMEELERLDPKGLNTYLLKSMVLVGEGRRPEARATLEKAQRRHPRSYLPPYNLARMALEMDNDKESAMEYYQLGRSLGGPVDPALEERIK